MTTLFKKTISIAVTLVMLFTMCLSAPMTVSAVTAKVTVNNSGNVYTVDATVGQELAAPTEKVNGMLFLGWYSDPACTVEYGAVQENETRKAYAKYPSTYIPFNEKGEKFALLTSSIQKASGDYTYLFEARADFVQYLQGINDQELANYILSIKKNVTQVRREPVLDEKGEPKFDENNEEVVNIIPCRRVGNVKEPNNNAGNWE